MVDHPDKAPLTPSLSRREQGSIEKRRRPRVPVLYEIIRQEGEAELERPASGLWWSGVAAGICIGFSVVSEGLLRANLPSAGWRPLIENFGYCVGFLIVVLGRQQLFTENTITAVLPVMAARSKAKVLAMIRLWGIVLAANLVGAFLFALFCSHDGLLAPGVSGAIQDISLHMMAMDPLDKFWRGIVAGWLIAVMVWIMPNTEGHPFVVVALITYLIALGDFTHVIAGSVEAFWLVLNGDVAVEAAIWEFLLPTFLGNVVGGSLLFAMLSYVQVHEEIRDASV